MRNLIKKISKISLYLWFLTVIIFFIFLLIIINSPQIPEPIDFFLLIDIALGFIFFLFFLYKIGQTRGLLSVIIMTIFAPIAVFCLAILIFQLPKIEFLSIKNNQKEETIECYIDGKKIFATREVCQQLSIRPTIPAPQIQVIQPKTQTLPRIQMPKNINCYNQYDIFGRISGIRCTEY